MIDIAIHNSTLNHIDEDVREAYHQAAMNSPRRICGWKIISEERPKIKKDDPKNDL